MQIITKKVSELKPYEKNHRKHPQKQIDLLAKNIKRFGFTTPVLISKDNEVIAGHGRLLALKQLGDSDVPCVLMDNLTDEEVKSLRLADNQIALMGETDLGLAIEELKGLSDEMFALTGFDRYLVGLGDVEDVDVSLDQLGVITVMPPEAPRLKEKAVLYCDDIEQYKEIKDRILNGKLLASDLL